MFKVVLETHTKYTEEGQVNPIRWKTMYKEGDVYRDQSGWIKCKDFFNDTVAFFKEGTVFSIYNYKNNIKKNDEGVYMLLDHIKDRSLFIHNLEVLAGRCFADDLDEWVVPIQPYASLPPDQVLVLIPNCFWESTYLISLITKCIRLSNFGIKYDNWEDFWSPLSPEARLEKKFDAKTREFVNTKGFKVPEEFSKYWFYSGINYNSQHTPKQDGSIIHDCGVATWIMWMYMEEEEELV